MTLRACSAGAAKALQPQHESPVSSGAGGAMVLLLARPAGQDRLLERDSGRAGVSITEHRPAAARAASTGYYGPAAEPAAFPCCEDLLACV